MGKTAKGFEFKKFATPRIVGGIAIVIIVLWALSIIFGPSQRQPSSDMADMQPPPAAEGSPAVTAGHSQPVQKVHTPASTASTKGHTTATADKQSPTVHGAAGTKGTATAQRAASTHGPTPHGVSDAQRQATSGHMKPAPTAAKAPASHPVPATAHNTGSGAHGADGQAAGQPSTTSGHLMPSTIAAAPVHKPIPKGVAFVAAAIKPLDFELEERWWGWRPNDIIIFTDNVNNFQMGVLEVTRRTTVALAERISRTGTTDAFDENLEQAMNWFMIKASSFWFPSAESKYREGLEELQAYLEKLKEGKATFYTRTDNLIPLLASFEDLLGSCDENLVKEVNEDGSPISSFNVDNYFFYTQGVANSMATVLEAVHHDFLLTLEQRNGTELLHHAIISCQRASEIDPWIILDRNLSSVFANHRANMAAPISHARFYLGQLIKTLST
jgi:hypothetical protein